MATVTISIGRNVGEAPMSAARWRGFREDVWDALRSADAEVYVDAAESVGKWEDVQEESATFVASVSVFRLSGLADALRSICGEYQQDAIALTVGETTLIGA